jgi:predicted ABC-type transport system involved in lysophospholipase L1 biosynthesis ATPase subunit
LVGVGRRLDHVPSVLSGGVKQGVDYARDIGKGTDVQLCD